MEHIKEICSQHIYSNYKALVTYIRIKFYNSHRLEWKIINNFSSCLFLKSYNNYAIVSVSLPFPSEN